MIKFGSITPGQRHKYEPTFETVFSGICKAAADIKLADFEMLFGKMSPDERLNYIMTNSFLKTIYDMGMHDGKLKAKQEEKHYEQWMASCQ